MLQHLSPRLFKERIASFDNSDKWNFICDVPTIILFRKEEHLLLKGFRDVYDRLTIEFPPVKTYEVIEDTDPQIAKAYDIEDFPSTMFIRPDKKYEIIDGFLSPQEAISEVKNFLLK